MGKFFFGCVSFVCVLALGCGGETGHIKVYPVRGKVLVKGQPAAGARIVFYPTTAVTDGKKLPTPAGETDDAGQYQLSSFAANDGAPPGEYKVTVAWLEPPPPKASGVFSQKDRLAGRYSNPDTTKLRAKVEKGGGEIPPLEFE